MPAFRIFSFLFSVHPDLPACGPLRMTPGGMIAHLILSAFNCGKSKPDRHTIVGVWRG
ncbi:hypothetical protein [Azospirillum palustre]